MAHNAKWTVVQHSGYGYKRDPQFEKGLETRRCMPRDQVVVTKVGGLLFEDYLEAEQFCDRAMYPPGVEGLIPAAAGTFSEKTVDQLRIYIPGASGRRLIDRAAQLHREELGRPQPEGKYLDGYSGCTR